VVLHYSVVMFDLCGATLLCGYGTLIDLCGATLLCGCDVNVEVKTEQNVLHDGTLIDLCGATLLCGCVVISVVLRYSVVVL